LTLLNKLPRFRAWREWGFYLREFQGAEAKGLIMRPHPHLPGAERQGDQKWRVEALAGRMEALGFLPRLRVLELTDDDQMESRRGEVDELMRQGTLKVTPGWNAKVDAVITRSLNKAEQVMIRTLADGVGTPGPKLKEEGSLLLSDLYVVRTCTAQ